MGIVDIEKLEKEYQKKEAEKSSIITKKVGDKIFFKGKSIDGWFESLDECYRENMAASSKLITDSLGLNEQGQTPAQVANMEARRELLKKEQELQEQLAKMQAQLRASVLREEEEPEEAKKRGRPRK